MAGLPTFSLDDELLELGGDQLSEKEAVKLIEDRLIKPRMVGTQDEYHFSSQTRKKLAVAMVAMIPESERTAAALANVDLRQLLQPLANNKASAKEFDEIDDPFSEAKIEISPALQEVALAEWVDLRIRVKDQLEAELGQLAATGRLPTDVDPESIPLYVDELLRETERPRGGKLGSGPVLGQPLFNADIVTDPTTGQQQVVNANPATQDFLEMAQAFLTDEPVVGNELSFMTDDDVEFLFRRETPKQAIGSYVDELAFRSRARAEGYSDVPADTLRVGMGAIPGVELPNYDPDPYMPGNESRRQFEQGTDPRPRDGKYSLTQALNLPFGMSRREIAALNRKMKKAGLYAQIEGGEPAVVDDATDPQFKRAYELLLSKSIQQGRPVSTVLSESMDAYEEATEDKLRTLLSDPARLRIMANSLSTQVLGRKATRAEQAQLVETIHGWQRDQTRAEDPDLEGDVVDVDWQARMEEMIRNNNPGEAGAHDVADQYDTFRTLLSGPEGLA